MNEDDIRDLAVMFTTPHVSTDMDGRHWGEDGREYRMVVVGGEATFEAVEDGEDRG